MAKVKEVCAPLIFTSKKVHGCTANNTIHMQVEMTETSLKTSDWVVRQFRAVAIRTGCSFNRVHNDISILSFVFIGLNI